MCLNDANESANSKDPDQTATLGAVCSGYATVCSDLSVREFQIITVVSFKQCLTNLKRRKCR